MINITKSQPAPECLTTFKIWTIKSIPELKNEFQELL